MFDENYDGAGDGYNDFPEDLEVDHDLDGEDPDDDGPEAEGGDFELAERGDYADDTADFEAHQLGLDAQDDDE